MYFVAKISLKYLIKYNKNNMIFGRKVYKCACDEYLYDNFEFILAESIFTVYNIFILMINNVRMKWENVDSKKISY